MFLPDRINNKTTFPGVGFRNYFRIEITVKPRTKIMNVGGPSDDE